MNAPPRPFESFDIVRVRILRETEAALLFGLTHPEAMTRIPTIEVGRAGFSPAFAEAFWNQTLGVEAESGLDV